MLAEAAANLPHRWVGVVIRSNGIRNYMELDNLRRTRDETARTVSPIGFDQDQAAAGRHAGRTDVVVELVLNKTVQPSKALQRWMQLVEDSSLKLVLVEAHGTGFLFAVS